MRGGWQKASSIPMYTVGMKYILNLFNNKSDLQIIKHNLSEIDNNILRLLDKPKTKEDEYSKDEYNICSTKQSKILYFEFRKT